MSKTPDHVLRTAIALCFASAGLVHAETAEPQDPAERLDAIVVTATRSPTILIEVPAAVALRDMDELRRDGFTVGTDEFRGVTGVFFRRGEGDGDEFPFLSFRGSTGTEGSLSLIDGIPIVGLYEEIQLNEIPYDALQSIEIVKGPVSALYGRGALYGATNYITRNPGADSLEGSLTFGSDGYKRAAALASGRKGNDRGWLLSAAHEDYDGWREQGGRRVSNVFGKVVLPLSEATQLIAYAIVNDRAAQLPNGIPLDPQGRPLEVFGGREGFLGFGEPRNDMTSVFTAANLEHAFSDSAVLSATLSYRDIERDVFLNFYDAFGTDLSRNVVGFNGFRGDTTQDVWFGETTLDWQSGRHRVIAGVSTERSDISEFIRWSGQNGFTPECGFTFYLVEVDYTTGQVVNANNPCFVLDDPRTRSGFRNTTSGVFIQDEITLSDRWFLTLGGRYDRFRRTAQFEAIPGVSDGGELRGNADAFSPKATLSFRPDWGQLYMAYGRGFNSNFGPTFEWDPVQYARPESRPTTIDSIEFGVKGQAFDGLLGYEAAVYRSEQKNRRTIIPNPDAVGDPTQPGQRIAFGDLYQVRGAEASVDIRPREGTVLALRYTYLDPEWKRFSVQTFSGPVDFSGNTPVGVPDSVGFVQLDQRVTEWLDLRASFESYSDYFFTIDNRFRGGGYDLLTLGARVSPPNWSGVTLDLTINNALDEEYFFLFGGRSAPTYATPGPPRQARLTLSGRF